MPRIHFAFWLLLAGGASLASADWQPPREGVFTEQQLSNCFAVTVEWLAISRAEGKTVQGAGGLAALEAAARADGKFQAALARHGMTNDEFAWVNSKVWEAWSVITMTQLMQQTQGDLEARQKQNDDEIAGLNQTIATDQDALKNGGRALTPQDRQSIVDSAKEDQKSALDDEKLQEDIAKSAGADAAKADADAADADTAMKNPPAGLSDEDKNSFIEEKKNAIEAAQDAAKDARDQQAEALKAAAADKARAGAAQQKIDHPELTVSDDEKTQYQQQVQKQLDQARTQLQAAMDAATSLKGSIENNKKNFEQMMPKAPQQNVEMLTKHRKDFEQIWNINQGK